MRVLVLIPTLAFRVTITLLTAVVAVPLFVLLSISIGIYGLLAPICDRILDWIGGEDAD